MRTLGVIQPVMLVVAGFSRYEPILQSIESELVRHFGPVALTGPTIEFRQTSYYEATMGAGLLKRYWAFSTLQSPDQLAAVKRCTIELEHQVALQSQHPEARPLNLDPGFLSLGKFLLATTKDQSHRIYLHGGIFAEVTLRFHEGEFEPRPWTYPDWQLPQVLSFLKKARDCYGRLRHALPPPSETMPALLVAGGDSTMS